MFILEAVPDMMMMICLQIFFIWVLQKFEKLLSLLFPIMKIELIYSYFISICFTYITNVSNDGVIHKRRTWKTLRRGCIWQRPFIKLYTLYSFIQKYIYPLLPPFKNDFVFLLSNLFILEFVFNMQGIIQFYLKGVYFTTSCIYHTCDDYFTVLRHFQIISFMMNRWQKQLKGAAL